MSAKSGSPDAYVRALAARGVEDFQPRYRAYLRALKEARPDAYEEAVARYRSELDGIPSEGDDLLRAWLSYGVWLAGRLAPGRVVTVGEAGRSTPVSGDVPLGAFAMLLPDDPRQRAAVISMPATPSPAQRETAALLCR